MTVNAAVAPNWLDFPPWRLSGLALAPLMNDPAALQALGATALAAPYKGAPKAPML